MYGVDDQRPRSVKLVDELDQANWSSSRLPRQTCTRAAFGTSGHERRTELASTAAALKPGVVPVGVVPVGVVPVGVVLVGVVPVGVVLVGVVLVGVVLVGVVLVGVGLEEVGPDLGALCLRRTQPRRRCGLRCWRRR